MAQANGQDGQGERLPQAAEYAIGLLEGDERRDFEARLAEDPVLRAELAAWRERLAGLIDEVAPVKPPPHLLPAIEARLFGAPDAASAPRRGFLGLFGLGGVFGGALAAFALLIALMVFLPDTSAPEPLYAAQMQASEGQSLAVAARVLETREIAYVTEAGTVPEGRVPELWAIFEGEAPISLGVLEDGQGRLPLSDAVAARLDEAPLFAITDEPPGGAPGGIPTGEVLAAGPLEPV